MGRVGSCRLNNKGVAAIQTKCRRSASVEAFCLHVGMPRSIYYKLIKRNTWFELGTLQDKLNLIGIRDAEQSGLIEFKETAQTCPNNLPPQLTSFIGRKKETDDVKALLSKSRLLTLTGAGGCGKTRLALHVAAELQENYPDGIWLVELAALTDPDLVPQALLSALKLREEPSCSPTETAIAYLESRTLLLIVDNCEHLIVACAQLATALMRGCPQVKILATSRETRNIGGETIYTVPSLSLPDKVAMPLSETEPVVDLASYDAVCLFVERARAVQPDFVLNDQNGPYIVEICRCLDGMPLAIELAAARVRCLSVEVIASRLGKIFHLLASNSPTALSRHQTIRTMIDWSYNLLDEDKKARILLDRLSVFRGGWRAEAIAPVCADDGMEDWQVLDLLASLVEKSLVMFEQREGKERYRLLETVRQYAEERLLVSGATDAVQRRHQDHFLALAEEAELGLKGKDQVDWLKRLEEEYENLRAALRWSLEQEGPQDGLRLCGALQTFWWMRGHFTEPESWVETCYDLSV